MRKSVSVAPMMDCTDRHDRYFLRLISKNTTPIIESKKEDKIEKTDQQSENEKNSAEKTTE